MGRAPVTDGAGSPAAAVDAMVAAIHPGVTGPDVDTRDAVLVTGPWLAGSTSLIAALRQRMPKQSFLEADELHSGESPMAIVFVVSAAAPVTDSDCALLDTAASNTDLVIGAVSKTDAHANWRDVLAADRVALSEHNPRYRDVAWVGVAAGPEEAEPVLDELVDALRRGLDDAELARRNRLRAWQTRLRGALRRHDDDAAGVGREARVVALREERGDALRRREVAKSERTAGLRNQIEQAKTQLTDFADKRCTSVRGELQEDASAMTRRRVPSFEKYVHGRVDEVVAEVGAGVTKHLADLATELGLAAPEPVPAPASPAVPSPALPSRRRAAALIPLLGAVVGAAVGFAVTRLFANLAPAYIVGAVAAGAVVGIGVAVGLRLARALRRDRSVLAGWVEQIIGELQSVLDRHVAERVAAADTALTAEVAEHDEGEAAEVADRVAGIDAELREHGIAAHRAATLRSREVPALQRALAAVQAELEPASGKAAN